jgi:hypothetical protein
MESRRMMKLIAALLLIPSLAFGDGRVRDADVATNAAIQPSKIAAGNWAGNAATATKLAASPTQCSAGQYASGIDQFANLTCSAVSGLPPQATHAGQYLGTDGTTASWSTVVAGINQLTGDVTAGAGSGSQAATVAFVGGSMASLVHTAELAANAATALNTVSTIVKRDGSGNFTAGTITAALTGNASTATALAADPSDCAANTYATTIAASGNLTCSTVTDTGLATPYVKADGTRGLSADWNAGAHNITATGFIGALTGNSSTTTALASTPTKCSAGNYPLGVDASGNAQNCTAAASANAITALMGDVTASGPGSVAATVAKIQSTTVSGTTGTTNVVFSSAPTLSNPVVGTQSLGDNSTKAASTAFVQSALAQLNPAAAVYAASTANIPGTYTNAVSGVCVADTFTVTATGALTIDGQTPAVGKRVLLKNQTSGFQNGVWDVTVAGTVGVSPVLTRSLDWDTSPDMNAGNLIPVINGTANANTVWFQTAVISTCSSDSEVFTQFSGGSSSPLTTKGDLYTYDTAGARLPVGSNGQILTPNSSATPGLNWVTALPTAAMPALTGDVTNSAGALATTIAANAVTNAKAAQMAAHTIKGNNTGSTANSLDLTDAQVAAELPAFVGDSGSGGTKGSVPAPSTADFAKRKMLSAGGSFTSQFSQVQNLTALDTSANSWALTKPDNFDAEASVGDWVAYADAAGTVPVDMTGGSPNTTCTRNTSSPIDGTADFLMTLTTGASRQGEGCSLLVNIPTAYRGKAIRLTFPYSTTGTIAAGDIVPYAYDVTNSSLLAPSNTISGITGSAGTLYSIFSTQTSTAQLRIGLHVARTSTAAATVEFDDVKLDPDFAQANVPMSDGVLKTFTFDNFGTVSTQNIYCRRNGDHLECEGTFVSGSPSASTADLVLPDGLTIDYSKIGTNSVQVGTLIGQLSGSTNLSAQLNYIITDGSTTNKVFISFATASGTLTKNTGSNAAINTGVVSLKFSVPISGWSSGGGTSPILSLSDRRTYTVSITGTTSNPAKGTTTIDQGYWSRIGDEMEITYDLKQTGAGTAGSGKYLFSLPAGYTIDSTKVKVDTNDGSNVGGFKFSNSADDANTTSVNGYVYPYDTTHLAAWYQSSSTQQTIVQSGSGDLSNTNLHYKFTARVPISGWTSTSSGTLTAPRTQAWLASINGFGSSNTAIARFSFINSQTGNITITQSATLGDSITINEEGIYSVSENVSLGNTGVAGISVNSNQLTTNLATITTTNRLCAAQVSAADVTAACGTSIHLNVGDVLRVHAASSGNSNGANGADSTFIVTKVSN